MATAGLLAVIMKRVDMYTVHLIEKTHRLNTKV